MNQQKMRTLLPKLIQDGAVIVDVRSRSEFQGGANPVSINIPLDELSQGLKKLDQNKPVVLCCASGMRSGMAVAVLKKNGFSQVYNGGPWHNTLVNS